MGDDKQACRSCGAANDITATFCWQCFQGFNVAMPAAPVGHAGTVGQADSVAQGAGSPRMVRPGFPAPMSSPEPITTAGSTVGVGMLPRVVVGLLAFALAFFGVQRFLAGRDIGVPDSVNGVPKMAGPLAASFDREVQSIADDFDISVQGAVYGTADSPDFLVVVANGAPEETADELFTALVDGMTRGGAVQSGETLAGGFDGASYRCLGARAEGIPVGTCMWVADRHVGVVLDIGGELADVESLTAEVYRLATS